MTEIDRDGDEHVYRQIAASIRARIDAGEWRRRLPSVTHFQQQYEGAARQTVMRALRHLADLGIIYTVRNRGSFIRTDVETVTLGPGARAIARPASDAERAELELGDGGWVVVVETGDGVEVYAADRVELRGPE